MRFNSLGHGLVSPSPSGSGSISIDGVLVPSLSTSVGSNWDWLDDATICGQSDPGTGYTFNKVVVATDLLSKVDPYGANVSAAGNGVIAAFLLGGVHGGVRFPLSTFGPYPLAAIGDVSREGLTVMVQSFQSTTTALLGVSTTGSVLSSSSVTLLPGYYIRAKDGVYAYQDYSGTHLRSISTGTLQSFAPRKEQIFQTVPITISGVQWVVEVSATRLTARPAVSSNGFEIQVGDTFSVDAVEVSPGVLRMGWTTTSGAGPTTLRMADLTVATGGFSTGTTASGSLVFTAQPDVSQSAIPVGPIEGGTTALRKQPRYAIKPDGFVEGENGKRIYQAWWDQIAGQAFSPPNLSQATGVLSPANGGTGTNTGLTVLDGGNILNGTITVNKFATDVSWIPLVTGAEPPVFVTDGAGVLILVPGPT
jgi:hypothetical protein